MSKHGADVAFDDEKAKTTKISTSMTPRSRSAPSTATASSSLHPFHLIGEDAHRKIFMYLLSLSPEPKMVKPIMGAFFFFCKARIQAVKANNPNASHGELSKILSSEFKALTKDERDRWDSVAEDDKERYRKEMQGFDAYNEKMKDGKETKSLARCCRDLSRVSRTWRDVTGDVINAHAPSGIISPRDLARLKRRASSLSLAPVRSAFVRDMTDFYGDKRWSTYDDDLGMVLKPLRAIVQHFAEGSNDKFAELVAVEYRKFLVVKSLEVTAPKQEFDLDAEASPFVKMLRGTPCKPTSKLVDMFWRAHMCLSTKYSADCHELVGKIIDGSAVYECTNSDYEEKVKAIFPFESKFRSDASKELFNSDFDFMDVAWSARRSLSSESFSDESEADY